MRAPSWTTAATVGVLAYFAYSMIGLAKMFWPPECPKGAKCMRSCLNDRPKYQAVFLTSTRESLNSQKRDVKVLDHWLLFDYDSQFENDVNLTLPLSTRKNGTLWLHIFIIPRLQSDGFLVLDLDTVLNIASSRRLTAYITYPLTVYREPDAETYNLLSSDGQEPKENSTTAQVVSHLKPSITFNLVTENLTLPLSGLPADIAGYLTRPRPDPLTLPPLLNVDVFGDRLAVQVRINSSMKSHPFKLRYEPISFGKFRVWKQFEISVTTLANFGFTQKDVDEVKSVFEMNPALLFVTMFVSICHVVFDFLAFKNDVQFWQSRKDTYGVSLRALKWRAFSQFVVFLYLWEQEASILIWLPAAVATVIECWKLTKAFKIHLDIIGFRLTFGVRSSAEKESSEFDALGMGYLTNLLVPLAIGYAIYSLLYTPHRGWYSWVLQALVGFVYGFGFLFMFPQLFLNYKLKSVAHLPWKAFTYKAFNTFIDDLFAFVITMPTLHRVACFRDDVVFLIYLYQRWLYPVDKTRMNEFGASYEEQEALEVLKHAKESRISKTSKQKKQD